MTDRRVLFFLKFINVSQLTKHDIKCSVEILMKCKNREVHTFHASMCRFSIEAKSGSVSVCPRSWSLFVLVSLLFGNFCDKRHRKKTIFAYCIRRFFPFDFYDKRCDDVTLVLCQHITHIHTRELLRNKITQIFVCFWLCVIRLRTKLNNMHKMAILTRAFVRLKLRTFQTGHKHI